DVTGLEPTAVRRGVSGLGAARLLAGTIAGAAYRLRHVLLAGGGGGRPLAGGGGGRRGGPAPGRGRGGGGRRGRAGGGGGPGAGATGGGGGGRRGGRAYFRLRRGGRALAAGHRAVPGTGRHRGRRGRRPAPAVSAGDRGAGDIWCRGARRCAR